MGNRTEADRGTFTAVDEFACERITPGLKS